MAITRESPAKDVLASPPAMAIVNKYVPDIQLDDPRLKATLWRSFKAFCALPQTGITKDRAEAMFRELEAADIR